jgi:glucosylceramidase
MVLHKLMPVKNWGKAFLLCAMVVAAASMPAHAVLKAKWRSSSPNARWVAEAQLPLQAYAAQATEIVLDTATKYQTMTGWGGSPNEVGMVALHTLPQAMQDSVIKALYDTVWGCKFNMIRLPIGCSDFSLTGYSLDDVDGDYAMNSITIDREKPMTLAFVKEAMKYNPGVKVWGSPWTAPAWMKKNKNWFGGASYPALDCELTQTDQIFTAYALYFSKAVTLYKNYGIPFFALSFQNEPYTCQPFPSMIWSNGTKILNFLKNYLGPRMQADHPNVELWTPTMNLNDTNYYVPMLRDAYTAPLVKACCFQYQGKDVIAVIHQKFPALPLYATELVCGGGDNTWDYPLSQTFPDIKYYVDNGAVGAMQWNLILEKNGRAGYNWSWSQNSMITMDTVAKTITFTSQYYCLKHLSFYIRPGSKLLKATGNFAVSQLSVKNTDGSIAVVAMNNASSAKAVAVRLGTQMITATMPALSFASFLIYDSTATGTNPAVARPENRAPAPRTIKVAGEGFTLPVEYAKTASVCAVYNLQGKLIRELSVVNNAVNLSRDYGMSRGIYIVRLRPQARP